MSIQQRGHGPPSDENDQDWRFTKICVLGDAGVGKTSLVRKFVHGCNLDRCNNRFENHQNVSVNHFFTNVQIEGQTRNLMIWDTTSSERFRQRTVQYTRNADSVVLVFDVTLRESFDNLVRYWLPNIDQWNRDCPIVLAGTRVDEAKWRGWAVSRKEIDQVRKANKLKFYETSASSGQNVTKLFSDAGNVKLDTFLESDDWVDLSDAFELEEEPRRKKTLFRKLFNCCLIA